MCSLDTGLIAGHKLQDSLSGQMIPSFMASYTDLIRRIYTKPCNRLPVGATKMSSSLRVVAVCHGGAK